MKSKFTRKCSKPLSRASRVDGMLSQAFGHATNIFLFIIDCMINFIMVIIQNSQKNQFGKFFLMIT